MFPLMQQPRYFSAAQVRAALPMTSAIQAMREAFGALATGRAHTPVRTAVAAASGGALLVMPGRITDPAVLGAKLVSVFPGNVNEPVVQALVVLLDAETGTPRALFDGTALTAIRTGAASGLATDLLARPDARRVAILGAGVQARTQLEAVRCVRPVQSVAVWSRTPARATSFADELQGDIRVAATAHDAVNGADIICCATSAVDPVLADTDVLPGTHINAVGSFTPTMREFDPEILGRAIVVVDQREAALAEAGEVISAVHAGILMTDQLIELGALVTGTARGRCTPADITVFKSVGLAVQDLVAAAVVERSGVQRQ
jgi:ornithine cyclodeaminase